MLAYLVYNSGTYITVVYGVGTDSWLQTLHAE